MLPVVLASGSPRRRDLLTQAGLDLTVITTDVDETPHPGEDAIVLAKRLARAKGDAVQRGRVDAAVVVSADTIVVRDGDVLGKPDDPDHALSMLRSLAGRTHEVVTAFAAVAPGLEIVQAVTTRVTFRALSDDLIRAYIATGEPMDKAGAYGIQGLAGKFVTRIDGSYTNVVGLPLVEVLDAIAELGGPRR